MYSPLTESDKPLTTQCTECLRYPNYHLLNKATGELKKLRCKSYSCPSCGRIKSQRLFSALNKYLKSFKNIRLFTFTFRTSNLSPIELNSQASKVWHVFMRSLRRCTALHDNQKKVQYVKFVELTKRGFIHFHVIMSEYMPLPILLPMWYKAINLVFDLVGKNGSINVRHAYNSKSVARYICKYVVKNATDMSRYKRRGWIEFNKVLRLWSKSGRVTIFDRYEKSGDWSMIIIPDSLILNTFSITAQKTYENLLNNEFLEPQME